MKKKIYQWHRTISLIIAIPVLLWAGSGFMHPIMTNIRPKIATQWLAPKIIDSSKIKVSLQDALLQNHIDSFTNFRIVHIANNWFYQVQRGENKEPIYLATLTGKLLVSGDWLYAQYLARQFLEGQEPDVNATRDPVLQKSDESTHDCCDAATATVLDNIRGVKIKDASYLTAFNSEYKSINRLLPVYRVSFNRPDGIRIYVETKQDRFSFAIDNKRKLFSRVFVLIHTWGWLDFLGKGKLLIEWILVSLAFLSTLFGIYLFFSTKSKPVKGNQLIRSRRSHRYTSISISVFTLFFTFSGAYHAFSKLSVDKRDQIYTDYVYPRAAIHFSFQDIQKITQNPILNISIVHMDNTDYWQVVKKNETSPLHNDLMKDSGIPMPAIAYYQLDKMKELTDGETKYAKFLATKFSGYPSDKIISLEPVTKFTGDYNFADKKLPVWRISYDENSHDRLFVETSTGKLSKRINTPGLWEDYSFNFLHKHEFLAWAGKSWKDFSTMFWAMAQIAVVIVGLQFYFKLRKSRKVKQQSSFND